MAKREVKSQKLSDVSLGFPLTFLAQSVLVILRENKFLHVLLNFTEKQHPGAVMLEWLKLNTAHQIKALNELTMN